MADDGLFREELDNKYLRGMETTVKDLRSYALSNFEYYKAYDDACSMRFVQSCSFLLEHINDGLLPGIDYVIEVGRLHDYSQNCPGNGYRSLVKLVEKCCYRILTLVRYVSSKRSSVFFRHETHSKELEAFVSMLGQLKACLHYAHEYSKCLEHKLVVDGYDETQYAIMHEVENLSQEIFFGHCLGFQFCESMQQPLNMMHLMLACYSEGFTKATAIAKVAATLIHSGKFYLSPELRAKKVVSATIDGDITFCKSFWSLSENNIVHNLTKFVSPTVALESTFNIPTDTILMELVGDGSESIRVEASSANGEPMPIPVRLISYTHRKGQLKSNSSKPPSDSLLIHCHGGGFVAQSSLSHASYLRHWAKDLDVPIVSIDYSLAPQFAYPRQVEEIFFAYCWILKNLEALGSTGKTIVLVGDSAGANLVLSTALRTIEKGVRKPDGVLCVYGCFLVRYSPTPSRLLSLSDPILPLGNLTNCLAAYIGIDIRLREDLYKKRKLQRQQQRQVLQQQKESEGEERRRRRRREEVGKRESIKSPSKAKVALQNFFRNSHFDFMKKQTRSSFKKTSKSCEFEDVALGCNSSRRLYSLHSQLSTGGGAAAAAASEQVDMRPSRSERILPLEAGAAADDDDDDVREALQQQYQRHRLLKRMSHDGRMQGVAASLSDEYVTPGTSNSNLVSASPPAVNTSTPTTPTTPPPPLEAAVEVDSEEEEERMREVDAEEEEMMREVDAEVRKLKEANFPDSAIVGHRKILLDMKALKKQLERTKDLYLSPVFAPDHLLRQLNCVSFVGLHLDPLLDESVHMAKRFKEAGAQQTSLDLVDDLPHGFLNFMHLSKEAHQAAHLCCLRLKRLFVAGNRNRLASESLSANVKLDSVVFTDIPVDVTATKQQSQVCLDDEAAAAAESSMPASPLAADPCTPLHPASLSDPLLTKSLLSTKL